MNTNDDLYGFLLSLGTNEVAHTGGDFLHHLQSVQSLLEDNGADLDMSRAGLFHSIYGTQGFQDFSLPLSDRPVIKNLIGERAEFVAFCNCVMNRDTFDEALARAMNTGDSFTIENREDKSSIVLSRDQLIDLSEVHLFDWLEQVKRSARGWNYRRTAYKNMARLVGTRALDLYDRVFADET